MVPRARRTARVRPMGLTPTASFAYSDPMGPEVRAGEAALTGGRIHAAGERAAFARRASWARARFARSAVPNSARKRSFRAALSALALLELLAAAAIARIVAADVVALGVDDGLGSTGGGGRAAGHRHGRGADGAAACGRDRLGAGERLVLVLHAAAVRRLCVLQLFGLFGCELSVEERQDDLFVNRDAEVLEHQVSLVLVLDEGILLGHRAQVDALAQVVHRVEMLAPALVDDLEDHEALELAHEVGR